MKKILLMTDNETEFFKTFGLRVAELRKARGLTQTELGELIGVNQTAVGSYEIGRRKDSAFAGFAVSESAGCIGERTDRGGIEF